ncbi:MAG: LuxR family transcriptional regulator [Bacteroidales bacterium]|nr:LuxR family transcriptional regulator [Bacteroidales bacterium]
MRTRLILSTFLALVFGTATIHAEYSDHRRGNLDSLENVVVKYTPDRIEKASEEELKDLINAYDDLMNGYLQINRERSMLFARKQIALASRMGWLVKKSEAEKTIGKHYWGSEQYDSAMFYFNLALKDVDQLAETADQETVDDSYSSLYGAIGNCLNMMDSIPQAMEYYRKAGEIFERHGWNESNAILYYNMGETWREEKDFDQAKECYDTSLKYALASGDSLQISSAMKGLGNLWLDRGKTRKAFKYLKEADSYYSLHDDQEFRARIETLDLMGKALAQQKKQLIIIILSLILLFLAACALLIAGRKAFILRRQRDGADEVIDEAMREKEADTELILTDRETEILPLIASGMTSPQIAEKLFLSLATIKWYRKRLLEKFDAANTAELISKAKEKGLV